MKTEPKSAYQLSAERRKVVAAPTTSVIPCDQRGMCDNNSISTRSCLINSRRFWTHSSSLQVTGKQSKKSIARKEAALLDALASEGGPPGSPERLFHQAIARQSPVPSRPSTAFKESPYIPAKKT
jgi:hypothetical protein